MRRTVAWHTPNNISTQVPHKQENGERPARSPFLYQLRQQALSTSEPERDFLAPAKVYREFFRALVKLRTEDEWPSSIQELGLMNVFKIRYRTPEARS